MRWLFCFLTFVIFSLLSASPIQAIATFSTDYVITYDVGEQGSTRVTFNIAQKNNLSTIYATSFSLSLSQTNLKNITVKDALGNITPEVSQTDNVTNINFDFKNKVVGRDEVNNFTIAFDSADIATKQGSVWEINIPKLEPNENTNSQQIVLRVPPSFKQPAYIDPRPSRVDGNTYYFSSASLGNKSISALFGTTQYFKAQLTYNLKNPLPKTFSTQIALPPDTAYQTVFIKAIEPKPVSIAADPDGNWLATYMIGPATDLLVRADLVIKLDFNPKIAPPPDNALYTRATKIWDYTDPDIAAKAVDLKTPKAIYDFVVNYLVYDYSRLTDPNAPNRPGAVWALANRESAICTEFTDLFIAIARRNGIAARENQGFALSTNDKLKPLSLTKDVLHAWPEYYDPVKKAWIQIDPTWGNTTGGIDYFNKLDLNHIVFAIHGLDSVQPLPAGAYKTTGGGSKDVFVAITSPEEFPTAIVKADYDRQENDRIYLALKNLSGVAAAPTIEVKKSSNVMAKTENPTMPPFSTYSLELKLTDRPHFYPSTEKLIISIDGQETSVDIFIKPNLPPSLLWGSLVLVLLGLALLARGLYLRRQRRKSPLHWQVNKP